MVPPRLPEDRHWTICGISLQALAFFLASAIQGGSSCGRAGGDRPRRGGAAGLGRPGALKLDFSVLTLEGNGGEVTEGTWATLSGLERGDDVVQGGGLEGTGTGVGGDMAL